MPDDFIRAIAEKPITPDVLGSAHIDALKRCYKNSAHEFNHCYPTLLDWLIHELEWACGWMRRYDAENTKLRQERNGGAQMLVKDMLRSLEFEMYRCECGRDVSGGGDERSPGGAPDTPEAIGGEKSAAGDG